LKQKFISPGSKLSSWVIMEMKQYREIDDEFCTDKIIFEKAKIQIFREHP